MTNNTQKKFNLVKYVYGRVYAEYVASGKSQTFTLEDIKTRDWKGILFWLKKNGNIGDFKYGETLKDGFKVTISRFNDKELMYDYYLKAIERNVIKNQLGVTSKEIAEANKSDIQDGDFENHVKDESKKRNIEKVSREDSTTSELNRELTKELAQAQ